PLWISVHTNAPTSMVAVLLALNTVAVGLFQVRLSRSASGVLRSGEAMMRGTAWVALAFIVFSFSDDIGSTAAIVLLVVGACAHAAGEMISSGGQWGVSMGLAPVERQGQYQGFAGLGFGI